MNQQKHEFKEGDKVHWTRKVYSGRTVTFTTMRATIIGFDPKRCMVAICRYGNGRKVHVHVERLRHDGEHTELTDAMTAMENKKDE